MTPEWASTIALFAGVVVGWAIVFATSEIRHRRAHKDAGRAHRAPGESGSPQ